MRDCPADVTPDSKVGELLERWPALERVLVEISPHFEALQNPVLRRTVAKVATLRQVAKVSGVPLAVLIERLRAGAGLPPVSVAAEDDGSPPARPDWAAAGAIVRSLDARADIEAGEHPMPAVMRELAQLAPGQVFELVTPFVPAPLVDLAREKGYDGRCLTEAPGLVRTWFRRAG